MGRRNQTAGVIYILLSTFAFGAMPILIRLGYDAEINVQTMLALRFMAAALLGWPVLLARRQALLSWRQLAGLVVVSLAYIGHTSSFFMAVASVPASTVAVIFYIYPVVVTILAILFLGERLTVPRALALGLAVFGCLSMLNFQLSGLSWHGLALALASGVCYAVYLVLSSQCIRGIPVVVASTWIMTGVALWFLAVGLTTQSLDVGFRPQGWVILAALVLFATVLAVQFSLAGMLRLGPSRAAILGTAEPMVAVALAAVVLGEQVGPFQILGGATILTAVLLLRLPVAEREPALSEPLSET